MGRRGGREVQRRESVERSKGGRGRGVDEGFKPIDIKSVGA